jgi:hypothetical protein
MFSNPLLSCLHLGIYASKSFLRVQLSKVKILNKNIVIWTSTRNFFLFLLKRVGGIGISHASLVNYIFSCQTEWNIIPSVSMMELSITHVPECRIRLVALCTAENKVWIGVPSDRHLLAHLVNSHFLSPCRPKQNKLQEKGFIILYKPL